MKKSLLTILCTLLSMFAWAQGTTAGDGSLSAQPYAEIEEQSGSSVLFFYYNMDYDETDPANFGMNADGTGITWTNVAGNVTKVVFDESFAQCTTITSTAFWFSRFGNMMSIDGLQYLNTTNVTDMTSMFSGCSSLTSLDVSRFKTDNVTDMWGMFYGCSSLTSLDLSGFKTDNVTDMWGMFSGCSSLTSLDVSGFKTDNVTDMWGMFSGCSGLTILDVSGFKTDNVTDMSSMFYGCSGLTSLDVRGFKTDNVTDMSYMFLNCSGLTSLDVSGFKTDNVTDMSWMFADCSSLTSLDVSGFNTENVTAMYVMFADCSGLTSLDVSGFKTDKVTNMSEMFEGCSALKTIYAGDGWSTASVEQGDSIFYHCTSLIGGAGTPYDSTHVDVSYAHIDGGENNPGYFTDKNSTPSQNFAEYIWEVGVNNNWDGDREPLYCGDGRGTYVGFFYAQEADWSEGKGAFKFRGAPDNWDNGNYGTGTINQDGLSGTLINDNASGNIIAEPAFYRAEVNLANMTYQLTSISAIGIIGPAQSGGWNIDTDMTYNKETRAWEATVDLAADEFKFRANHAWDINWGGTADSLIANGDNLRIAEAGTYFIQFFPLCETKSYCIITKKSSAGTTPEPYAVLSENNTILTFYYDTNKSSYRETYGVGPFDNGETGRGWHEMRTQITKVSFDSSFANCTALTSLAWWFSGMSNLVTIEGLANLNTSNVTDMWGMFEYCSSLSSLDLRTFDTRNVEKMAYMLDGCTSLQSLNISSFITSNVKEMGAMFQDCSSLPSLDVTGFDVQNNRSLWGTFAGLTVSTLDISSFNTAKVDDMGYMFARNPNLTTIYVGSGWTTASVAPSDVTGSVGGYDMFAGCTSLVGGAGTPYDANHVDETYAHIDGGATNPGYFTAKNAAPVVDEDLKDDVYTVGESDFSTEFYTQFSKYYQIPQGGKWVSKFKLNLNPNDNRIYKNFVLLITNDEDRGAGQYKEYGAFRYDAVADSTRTNSQWGTSYVFPFQYTTSTLYLEPDENEMDPNVQKLGGLVTLTVDRSQADAFVITMSNEQGVVKTYRQPYVLPNFNNDSTNTNIRCFITVENSQLEFKGSNIEPIGGYTAPVATVEPYAVLKGDTLLTFYYDDQKSVRGGIAFLDGTDVNWPSSITSVTQAFFDSSFAEFSPTSTANWFNGFTSLTTITGLEFLNTANVTNMGSMFRGCSSLKEFDLGSINTSQVRYMESMFNNCSSLTNLNLSSFNTSNVTSMFGMFAECKKLTELDLSSFETTNTTDMQVMFSSASQLKTIYVGSGWDVSNVRSSDYMFLGCTSLVGGAGTPYDADHVDASYAHIDGGSANPGYFTRSGDSPWVDPVIVAAPEFRFEGDNLTMTAETPDAGIFYKVADLPSMAEAVVDSVVNSLIVTADGQSTYYDQPFELKKAAVVKAIAIIRNETGTFASDTTTMVYDYEAWVNLKAAVESGADLYGRAQGNPNVDTQSLEQLQWALNEGDMIYNDRAQMDSYEASHFTQRINELCAQIEAQMAEDEPYAVLSDNNTVLRFYYDKQKSARGGMSVGPFTERRQQEWFSERNTITNVVFDESFANCTSLTSTAYWFADLVNLTTITGISNLKTNNVTDMNSMFMFCRNLTSLEVSGFNTSNVTNMESMFYECSSLTSLDVSKFNTSKVTNMMAMFQLCSGLTALDVSNFDMSNVTSLMQMFCECSGLTSLKLGAFNIEKVTDIQGLFYGLSSMRELDLSSINTSNIEGMAMLFQNCTSLTTLNLSNFNTANVANMMQMFFDCTNLKTIYVGDDWTTSQVTNSERMFDGCTVLIGGAGTPYDANHVDANYAHIDGGSANPGYFTRNGDSPWVDPVIVAAPVFRFEGDNLTMTTETQDAGIFYKVADLPSMAEAVVDSVVNSLVVTADGQSTYYDQPFELKKAAVVKAIAIIRNETGTFASDTTTMVYDYEAWVNLKAAVSSGADLYGRAQGNPNVDTQLLEQLQWALNEGDMIYNQRAQMDSFEAKHFTQRINELCAEIERMMQVEAQFEHGVLYVYGSATMAEAIQEFGISNINETISAIKWNSSNPLTNDDLRNITNPNLLIYVEADSLAPANRNNVIINGYAKNIVLTDLAQGNNDFNCVENFTAEAISYTREFRQKTQIGVSRGWETVALPFTVQTIMHETRGVITPFGNSSGNAHFWLRRLGDNGLYSPTMIEANTAYLISMPNSEEYDEKFNLNGKVTFSAENVVVTGDIVKDESADYLMAPVFQRLRAQDNLYALNVNEERSGYPEGSVFEPNYRELRPFEALVEHKGANPAPPRFIVGDLGGDTTGIEAMLVNSERDNSDTWYDLSGRKLQGKPAAKGVYIHHGKKKIIK